MWREPTTDDFRDALLEDELLAWQSVSVAEGKDPAAKAIDNAIGRFRAALRAGYSGTLGADRTLPHDLSASCMHVAVFHFLGGRGGAAVSEDRRTLYKDAIRLAERIEEGKLAYTDPDDVEDTAAPSDSFPKPAFRPRERRLTRRTQEGI